MKSTNPSVVTAVPPVNTDLSPNLKDSNITPGSILDMDGDGRRDTKEMSLHELWHLQHGDVNARGVCIQAQPPSQLAISNILPSGKIAPFSDIRPPQMDTCKPQPFDDEQ